MLTNRENDLIEASGLGAVDKMAVRTAIASLELLRLVSHATEKDIGDIELSDLVSWLKDG